MEGMKGGGGRVCVGEDEMSDGMQCIDHPHRNNTSGICAFCLQDKLGKLVSSSFPSSSSFSSSSSSSSSPPSFRSQTAYNSITTAAAASTTSAPPPATTSSSSSSSSYSSLSLSVLPTKKNRVGDHHESYTRSRLPFLLAKKNKKKKPFTNTSSSSSDIIFKRSKSSATPRRDQFVDDEDLSPRKRNGFWSFLHLSSKPSASSSSCSKKFEAKSFGDINGSTRISTGKQRDKCLKSDMVAEEDASSSRSRSVGCGSRSFSGDFFERISTGLGDCTLRRVESQREGNNKPKVAAAGGAAVNRGGDHHHRQHHHHCMKEIVRCGGIFGGFMMMTTSSSSPPSLSCSSYWVSSSADDSMNGESVDVGLSNGRPKSWGWAFASPMRAFSSKTSSKENKRDVIRDSSDNNGTPNLSAIPSLLTVTG